MLPLGPDEVRSHPEVDLPSPIFSWEGLQHFNFTDKNESTCPPML